MKVCYNHDVPFGLKKKGRQSEPPFYGNRKYFFVLHPNTQRADVLVDGWDEANGKDTGYADDQGDSQEEVLADDRQGFFGFVDEHDLYNT
jgi:hypothetical protein